MTFKPFNKNYDNKTDYMDQIRKRIGTGHSSVIITREINAEKVHYNAMIFTNKTDFDLKNHDKQTKRFKIYCKKVPMTDKRKVHEYIVKESKTRYFYSKQQVFANQDIYIK